MPSLPTTRSALPTTRHIAARERHRPWLTLLIAVLIGLALAASPAAAEKGGKGGGKKGGGGSDPQPELFTAGFTGNTGLDQFRSGVYHRNMGSQELGQPTEIWGDSNAAHGGSWTADHDLACGTPDTQRSVTSSREDFATDQLVYLCRDHLMTTMGDVDGYSIVWFSPDRVFDSAEFSTVSWDVNVTDLLKRQWWEVSIVPAGTEFLATTDWLADVANIGRYHPDAIVVGNGPFGGNVNLSVNGVDGYSGWQPVCGEWGMDPEGCASKKIRRSFSVADNNNGTVTVNFGGMFTRTVPGQLPSSFQVYFKDHNYTPDKDGQPTGHTWHWDNIAVG